MLIKRDPILNAHKRKWIFLFPLFAFPTFSISSRKVDKYVQIYGDKYLCDLTDAELDDFEHQY